MRWKRDQHGEKYNIEEKIAPKPSPEFVCQCVRDASGRSYKKLVAREEPQRDLVPKWVTDPDTGRKVQMLSLASPGERRTQTHGSAASTSQFIDHRLSSGLPDCRSGRETSSSRKFERGPGFVTVGGHSAEEKQGKGSIADIVKFARDCPVAWTSKVTSDKLNLGLWSWAYMSQLLATRTGQAPSLGQGVLEAKMQHFLNVLEIALQPSNSTEFDAHSWHVARLYAEKIQNKVDRGDTWKKFDEKYGTDSQPSELMAAKEEIGPKQPARKSVKVKDEKTDTTGSRGTGSRRVCNTWNTSAVEGKCDFEIQYEGRTCDRRHECSWCKEKGKRVLTHQRTFCRQRIAAGDQ